MPRSTKTVERVPGSFRDPSGFVFCQSGSVYRQVNMAYKDHFDHLMKSGLYRHLVNNGLLIEHHDVNMVAPCPSTAYKILKPRHVPFISYPYEWSFSQLKDAALTTLRIQALSIDFGMSLKDCSAYNIQFVGGRPMLIDTLSFEKYQEGQPWVAYRQFCQHFLAPLSLMSYKDVRLSQLLRIYIDGIPLDMVSSLLPLRTWLKLSLFSHIHLHAKSQKHYAHKTINTQSRKLSKLSLQGLISNLDSAISKLSWSPGDTEWTDYYEDTNYSTKAFQHKLQLVEGFIERKNATYVLDLGANTGIFSRLASDRGIPTLAIDGDPSAVEKNYREQVTREEDHIIPLLMDLTNPSPGIGWANQERISLQERGPVDMVFALALIHHLAISNNVPLSHIAAFLSRLCNSLVVEFIPKTDTQVQRLLSTRQDVFDTYNQLAFEESFEEYFTIEESAKIRDSERTIYLMTGKNDLHE
ncbi:SAM-dependent methyltransferase [Planctomycetota bacterium]